MEDKNDKKTEVKIKKIILNPEQLASRQQAHAIKVAKSIAGGKP